MLKRLLFLLLLTSGAHGGLPLQVAFRVCDPIVPARVANRTVLVYELHLDNYSGQPITLDELDVIDGRGQNLARYRDLKPMLAGGQNVVPVHGQTTVFMWVEVNRAPERLSHHLHFSHDNKSWSMEGAPAPVSGEASLQLGLPFEPHGLVWVAANGPGPASGHRRALICLDGAANISQRFAIDWIALHPDGEEHHGDAGQNSSYACFGLPAVAVADAVVAVVQDGIPLNKPGLHSRAVEIDRGNVGGNTVGLDLGGGRYAMYAHLQPGSIRVKPGDQVKRGQVLGLIGNTGNSTQPHLHFHLANEKDWLRASGLPYTLEKFTVMNVDTENKKITPGREAHDELPALNQFVRF